MTDGEVCAVPCVECFAPAGRWCVAPPGVTRSACASRRLLAVIERDRPIVELAKRIGQHWRDQEGVTSSMLDQLAEVTRG